MVNNSRMVGVCAGCGAIGNDPHRPNCPYVKETTGMSMPTDPPPDAWAKFGVIAERLGVKPIDPKTASGITYVQLVNGPAYDLFEVIIAVLDRIDNATKS